MSMFKKAIDKYVAGVNALSVTDFAKRISYLASKVSVAKAVMTHAHSVRKFAAEKYGCKASEISFPECLKMAWEALRSWRAIEKKPRNRDGYVSFENRGNCEGDRFSWVLVGVDRLTVAKGEKNFLPPTRRNFRTTARALG